jgi:hypothetical protein
LEIAIKRSGNDNSVGYPELLRSSEYKNFCRDPFNGGKRESFISLISPSIKSKKPKGENHHMCYCFNGLQVLSINPSHINAYFIIPAFVYSMTITLKNVNTYNLAERDYNKEVGMIRFLT